MSDFAEWLEARWEGTPEAQRIAALREWLAGADRARITELKLSDHELELGLEGWDILLAQDWAALRSLQVYDPDCTPEIAALIAGHGNALPALRELSFQGFMSASLGDMGCANLAGATWLSRLHELSLINCRVGPQGIDALARHDVATEPELQMLDLGRGEYTLNQIGARGAAALADAPLFANLRRLSLSFCGIGDEGATALARSRSMRSLEYLTVFANDIRDSGCADLSRSDALESCRSLDLRGNAIGYPGIDAMCRWHPPKLQSLALGGNPVGDRAVRALATSPLLGQLDTLDLSDCQLTDDAVDVFLGCGQLAGRLERLSLRSNHFSESAVTRLKDQFGDVVRV